MPETANERRVGFPQRFGTGRAVAGPGRGNIRGPDIERTHPTGTGPGHTVPGKVLDPRGCHHDLRLFACRLQAGLLGHLLIAELKLIEPGVDAIFREKFGVSTGLREFAIIYDM